MDIMPLVSQNKDLIGSYGEGKFLVNNREYCGSIVVFPGKVIELKESGIDSEEHFKPFLTEEVEILLIGTGKTRSIPSSSVKSYLMGQKGLIFEFMTTGSACRTHNVLVSEDRFVVSYLIAI